MFWVKILCSVRKSFFYVCYISTLFQLQVFTFFCELIQLGSKLDLQRAQFRSWPTELGSLPNSKSLIYIPKKWERQDHLSKILGGCKYIAQLSPSSTEDDRAEAESDLKVYNKNPTHGRHWNSPPMRIVAPIPKQFFKIFWFFSRVGG